MSLIRFLIAVLLLPMVASANDASEFTGASSAEQVRLLEAWAAEPVPARLGLLVALQEGRVASDADKKPFIETNDVMVGADGTTPATEPVRKLRLNNRLRGLVETALASHRLLSEDRQVRLAAALELQRSARPNQLTLLDRQTASEQDESVKTALTLALANLQLVDPTPSVRLAAVRLLGETGEPLARTRLENLLAPGVETDPGVRTAAETSLVQVKRKLMIGDILGQAFSGMSLGSILLLAALGLAITFGLLGVINMAHGEMLMLGAYSTYVVQMLIQRLAPGAVEYYPLIALPVAFFVTAGIGMILERTVIRHLYGRPLETLLATWGISLMLIQAIRLLFGAQNVEVANPAWLSGGWQVLPNLVLPYNRIVIIAFALFVVVLT